MASTEPERENREDETEVNEDEDTGAQVAPIVRLEEVAVTTGEEDEDAVLDLYVTRSVNILVSLPLVKVSVGFSIEDECRIFDRRCILLGLWFCRKSKMYRFDKEGNQWKERGAGTVKLLKHKETGKVRLVMRQSKTLKICANHLSMFDSLSKKIFFFFLRKG